MIFLSNGRRGRPGDEWSNRCRTRSFCMSIEFRCKAAANAFLRAREAGRPIESHSDFLSWIEQWIAGEIEVSEVANRYRGLLAQRGDVRRSRTTPLASDILRRRRPGSNQTERFRSGNGDQPVGVRGTGYVDRTIPMESLSGSRQLRSALIPSPFRKRHRGRHWWGHRLRNAESILPFPVSRR